LTFIPPGVQVGEFSIATLGDFYITDDKGLADIDTVIDIFKKYCLHDENIISKELFQKNLDAKRLNRDFNIDMNTLLPHQIKWVFDEAFDYVQKYIVSRI
jgi:hypothetical protein